MELMDAIRSRRAVREFEDRRIERSLIENLIDAAVLAPSAMNLQPWAFAVSLDPERIDQMASEAKAHLLKHFSTTGPEVSLHQMVENPKYVIFYHAPALMLVLARSAETQATEDCCLAAQNLMLAARNQGLGTCWIGLARLWLNLPSTKATLKLPG